MHALYLKRSNVGGGGQMGAREHRRGAAENLVQNPVTMPGRNGGTLKRGGTNPRAGRPKGTFREFLHTVREDPAYRDAIVAVARDPEAKAFGHVLRMLSDYDPNGPNPRVSMADVKTRLVRMLTLIRSRECWNSEELVDALAGVWK